MAYAANIALLLDIGPDEATCDLNHVLALGVHFSLENNSFFKFPNTCLWILIESLRNLKTQSFFY